MPHLRSVVAAAVALLGAGCGSMGGAAQADAGGSTHYAHAERRLGACAEAVAAGDLNGDGRADAVVALDAGHALAVLLGDGRGGLSDPQTLPMPGQPREVTLVDVNEDGALDLLVVLLQARELVVLLGRGDGTFPTRTTVDLDLCPGGAPGLVGPEGLALGDWNADDHVDLVVTQAQDSQCRTAGLLLGDGRGHFALSKVPLPGAPGAAVGAHLNDDEHLDLAVTLRDRGALVVLLGQGQGELGPPARHPAGRTPGSVAAGDFDKDGDIDLVTANREDSTLAVFSNRGDGGLLPPRILRAGTITDQVVAADLNGDGWLDLAAANGGLDELTVHEGTPVGFQEAAYTPAGHCINDLTVADLDRDGHADLLAANCGGESLSVFRYDGRVSGPPRVSRRRGTIPSEAERHPGAPRPR